MKLRVIQFIKIRTNVKFNDIIKLKSFSENEENISTVECSIFEFSTMRKQFFIFYGFFASTTFLPWERIFAIHFTFYSNFMTSSTIFFPRPPQLLQCREENDFQC